MLANIATLQDKFRGCLLGGLVGDVTGAVVEAEAPLYIARRYQSIDDILAAGTVEEFTGPAWRVGRYTDDTQMTICVAEWLIEDDPPHAPQRLFARFADAYERWRRYGPGTEGILRLYPQHPDEWRELATMMFPHGSHGNGGAMRVAPVGLAYHNDLDRAAAVAIESSRPTHSHPLAYMGAVLQAVAVAIVTAANMPIDPAELLRALRARLTYFADLMQDVSPFADALHAIEHGLARGASCAEMSETLGTGVTAVEAVPMALYCFLRHPDSFEEVIHDAVYLGGDTDTIASMAGALSGAYLGKEGIPQRWLDTVREDRYTPAEIERLADRLFVRFARQ